MITDPKLPDQIAGTDFAAALQSLGISTDWIEEIHYHRGQLTLTYCRTTAEDRPMAAGDQLATVQVLVDVTRPVSTAHLRSTAAGAR